jgi:glycosyltransferase involved in cell wall biosynthesis
MGPRDVERDGTTPAPRAERSEASVSVVIPAFNAERTIGAVLTALRNQSAPPEEVIVVDDGSTDDTAAVATEHGVRVIRMSAPTYAGGARNRGWDESTGDVVVFLDSDAVPAPGWDQGLRAALAEFPGALIGCARTFEASTRWGWVAHLQCETPYLPIGDPRDVRFLSSYCLAVPRDLELRWDESYGGEDGLFSADAIALGRRLVFDPRFHARHDHARQTFTSLKRQQQRLAYGLARVGRVQREGLHKRVLARVPLHYFVLARLPVIFRRTRAFPQLRSRFVRLLPWMILAEWTLGAQAVRYAIAQPKARGRPEESFRGSG